MTPGPRPRLFRTIQAFNSIDLIFRGRLRNCHNAQPRSPLNDRSVAAISEDEFLVFCPGQSGETASMQAFLLNDGLSERAKVDRSEGADRLSHTDIVRERGREISAETIDFDSRRPEVRRPAAQP